MSKQDKLETQPELAFSAVALLDPRWRIYFINQLKFYLSPSLTIFINKIRHDY